MSPKRPSKFNWGYVGFVIVIALVLFVAYTLWPR